MPESWKDTLVHASRPVRLAAAAALGMLTLFLLIGTLNELRDLVKDDYSAPTITVSGEGTATEVPDTATVSFTASATANDVASAQQKMTASVNAALDAIKGQGISSDDVTTTSYNVSPHYETPVCTPGMLCAQGGTKGYDVSESVEVKIHDTSKVAAVLDGLAKAGVQNVSGPNFVVADTQKVMQDAREQAIAKARADAQKLANQLGKRLGKMTYFQDNNNSTDNPQPMYKMSAQAMDAASAPTIPTGSNTYTDSVSMTFELK